MKKPGLCPVPAFAGVHVELLAVHVHLFGKVVRKSTLSHEPPDMLDRGGGIQPVAPEPPLRINHDHGRGVAYHFYGVVVPNADVGAGVLVPVVALCDVLHVFLPLSFLSCPFGQVYITTFPLIRQGSLLDV